MRTVLITGCSSGIGLETAATLAASGFRVFATIRDLTKRGPLETALAARSATAELLPLDVTNPDSVTAAVDTVVERAGRIDALVNNAGFVIAGFVEDLTLDEYRRQFDTNFLGLVAVTKAVLPQMRRQRAGRIVNISSLNGRLALGALSAYSASKFAVEGFSEALAFEARLFGVQVVIVEPGMFKTKIRDANRQMAAAAKDPASPYFELTSLAEERVMRLADRMAGDPRRVADVVRRALTTRRPRLRYQVGFDARFLIALERLTGFPGYHWAIHRAIGVRPRDLVVADRP